MARSINSVNGPGPAPLTSAPAELHLQGKYLPGRLSLGIGRIFHMDPSTPPSTHPLLLLLLHLLVALSNGGGDALVN